MASQHEPSPKRLKLQDEPEIEKEVEEEKNEEEKENGDNVEENAGKKGEKEKMEENTGKKGEKEKMEENTEENAGKEGEKEKMEESAGKEGKEEKRKATWGLDAEGEGVRQVVIFERRPEEVGMTEFLGVQRGFSGIVKNRWEDFHVHEIDLQGQVVRLTSTDLPEEDLKEKEKVDLSVLSEEARENLNRVVEGELKKFTLPAPGDKEDRKKLHMAIKASFPSLNSNTEECEGEKVLEIIQKKNVKGALRGNPSRTCRFVLHKQGRDTAASVSVLAGLLKIHPQKISFCGNKDKRAVTSQLMTVHNVSAARLLALNPTLRGIKLGNFSYVKKSLQLGDLSGNRFSIVIREVEGSTEDIDAAAQSLRDHGFINYFGLQRFGTSPVASHEIGLAIIRGQWEKAIDMLMAPQPTDLPIVRDLKQKFKENGDVGAALHGMSDHVTRNLLHGLAKFGKNVQALQELPRQTRQLYIHSLQSLLWNRLASRRIRERGMKVCVGDLVIRKECLKQHVKTPNAILQVTEENKKDISVYDLVIPLPGYDVTFGSGFLKEWYQEVLLEMELTESLFKNEIRAFSAAGTYRAFLVRPGDVSHHVTRYSDPELPLLASDWEKLTKQAPSGEDKDGSSRAVVVSFSLPKSSYGTVAMREMVRHVRVKK